MTSLELLAPARTADIGIAAISCGADAVYIGGPSFGARVAAGNSVPEIARLCEYAHKFGARVFVTVNTLFDNDGERREAVGLIRELDEVGVDAIIMQDPSIIGMLAEKKDWKTAFHASTQCAIRTPERALELARMGYSRLVLERQMSLEQIRAIRSALPAETELEFFVHGALCVCYSGDCYLSELLTGRSANRGECAQPCRSRYDLVDADGKVIVKDEPLLSLKDYRLVGRMEEMADAGIISFKIEGRLKNASYVKNVVRAYSLALDELVRKRPGDFCRASFGSVEGGFTPSLEKTFNRGYTDLFIDGRRGTWHSREAATSMGEKVGKVVRTLRDGFVLETKAGGKMTFSNGDGLCFATAKGVEGFRADVIEKNPQGLIVHARPDTMPSPGTEIWRNRDNAFEQSLENNMPDRLLRIALNVSLQKGSIQIAALREDGTSFAIRENLPEDCPVATNTERMEQMIRSQLGKTAGRCRFNVEDILCSGAMPLLGAGYLNSLRRNLALMSEEYPIQKRAASISHLAAPEGISAVHPRTEGELMRTKYCIRHRLGLCLKNSPKQTLYLRNNGRLLQLEFDCQHCEMVVKKA